MKTIATTHETIEEAREEIQRRMNAKEWNGHMITDVYVGGVKKVGLQVFVPDEEIEFCYEVNVK